MSRARDLADLGGSANAGTVTGESLIINGDCSVAQRSTSVTGQTGGGYKAIDRFRGDQSNFTATYSQDTDVPSGYGFSNSFKVENTTSASSDNGVLRIEHRIEAQNLRNSGWDYNSSSSYLTFSCWVKSSLAGTYYFVFKTDDGTARQYTEAFTLTAATWEKLEITISGDSGITINNDNGIGGICTFFVDDKTANTDDATTLNGWQDYSSTSRVPDLDQKWTETDNSTFHFTGMKLEVGTKATSFKHESYADNLAKCRRYFETNYPEGNYPSDVIGDTIGAGLTYRTGGSTNEYDTHPFKVRKRANPAVVAYNGLDGGTGDWRGSGSTDYGVTLYDNEESFTAQIGNAGSLIRSAFYTADAEL